MKKFRYEIYVERMIVDGVNCYCFSCPKLHRRIEICNEGIFLNFYENIYLKNIDIINYMLFTVSLDNFNFTLYLRQFKI